MFDQHKKSESVSSFALKGFIFLMTLLAKTVLSLGFHKPTLPQRLGINWEIHKQRFFDYDEGLFVIDYFYRKMTKEQLRLFKYVNLLQVARYFLNIRSVGDLTGNNFDNIFYRCVCAIEFSLLENIVKQNNIRHLFINGLNDRYTIYLTEICKKEGVKLSIIQHGALTKFEDCYTVYADEFLYMYEFSRPFLKYFIRNDQEVAFLPCKRKKSLQLGTFEKHPNVAYASTPSNIHLNYAIIDAILLNLDARVNVLIHPHPREDDELYLAKYKHYPNVIVTKTKYQNITYLITRISSLGVDMHDLGIEPVFVNLQHHDTDYLSTNVFRTFTTLEPFRDWLITESTLHTFYDA